MIFNQYETMLRHVYEQGVPKADRTGTGTRSIFGMQARFDLDQGFPAVTTKKMGLYAGVGETLGFLRGYTSAAQFRALGCNFWNQNANENDAWLANPKRKGVDDLGAIYGAQWRAWPTADGRYLDQIQKIVDQLSTNPDDRGILVSAWNVGEFEAMALRPCHALFQFHSTELTLAERTAIWNKGWPPETDGQKDLHELYDAHCIPRRALSCQLYQRSADMFLGVPWNIVSYSLLTHMVAQQVGMQPKDFVWTGGDCHIYDNHVQQVELQLTRDPLPAPTLKLRRARSIFDYGPRDVEFEGYEAHPAIPGAMAV